jgi:serine/threonine protein kinase
MATVYRGFDVRLQVPRAVKVLAPNLAGRRALRERFEAEARTMALFDHPNIVRVVDVGMDGDRVYIIMELVSGGSLLERVRDFGPLPPRLALDVMLEYAFGPSTARAREVLGCDQVLRVKRLNLANGEPFAVVTVWCPAEIGHHFSRTTSC